MVWFDNQRRNCAEGNHQAEAGVSSITRRDHDHVSSLDHLRRDKSGGEIAHQYRARFRMKL